MKLEDLFKTKEPTNYVEKASQGQESPLQQFLKERTPKPAAIAAPTPKASVPIDEKTINAIKQEYSPAPTEEDQTALTQSQSNIIPQGESYVPVSNMLDMERIKSQADVLAPKQTPWQDALASLTPLAVEALLGQGVPGGVSAGIAGESVLGDLSQRQKRRQTLEDKLMELKKVGSSKADLELGRMARFNASQKQRQANEDRKIIIQTRDKLNQDQEFKKARTRYAATNDAINVLNQKNWASDAGVGFLFAKGIFGEVGSLTNEERSAFIANPALNNQFNFLYSKYLQNGTFTDEDRKTLTNLAMHLRDRAKQDLGAVAGAYTEGVKSIGIDPSAIVQPLVRTRDIAPKYGGQAVPGLKGATPDVIQRKDAKGNVWTYRLNKKTGKYE